MSKERLEEISERVIVDKVYYKYLDGTKGRWGKTYTLNEEDYDHLIEQAERVQELERQVEVCQKYLNKHIDWLDRKSTRLNSSHVAISYAVFCLKKKRT